MLSLWIVYLKTRRHYWLYIVPLDCLFQNKASNPGSMLSLWIAYLRTRRHYWLYCISLVCLSHNQASTPGSVIYLWFAYLRTRRPFLALYLTRFNKICHPSQRPRWQVDKEATGLSTGFPPLLQRAASALPTPPLVHSSSHIPYTQTKTIRLNLSPILLTPGLDQVHLIDATTTY